MGRKEIEVEVIVYRKPETQPYLQPANSCLRVVKFKNIIDDKKVE